VLHAVRQLESETVFLDGGEMFAARHHRHVSAGVLQARRQMSADRAGPENADFHETTYPAIRAFDQAAARLR
jgi:hypothetical protein